MDGTRQKGEAAGLTSALKEQLALITFVVLFAGVVSTETYYSAFGIRYQVLALSVPHLVSRGLTAVIDSPFLLLAYLTAIVWLSAGAAWIGRERPGLAGFIQLISYVLIFVVVAVSYYSAVAAGRHGAETDLAGATSRLPTVQSMTSPEGKPLPYEGFRLLTAGADTVAVFKPAQSRAESPFIHLLKRDSVGEITISR